MAAQPETLTLGRQPYQPEMAGDQKNSDNPLHPSANQEGVLYSDYVLPDYEFAAGNPSAQMGKTERLGSVGTTSLDRWQMHDAGNTKYKVLRCQSANPITDIWIVKDTALGTQVEGFNTEVAAELMGLGFNVLVKGPEIGTSLAQSESAYNTHKLLDAYQQQGVMDATTIALEGYSRGAMLAFGTIAYADRFNRRAVYSNLTDPCVGIAVGFNRETALKGLRLPADFGMLAVSVARSVLPPNPDRHLRDTADLSRDGAVQFVRTLRPLLNAESAMMATQVPKDIKATIAFFSLCGFNDQQVYRAILGNKEGVVFKNPPGGHGEGVAQRIIGNVALRFGRLGEQLEEGRSIDEIDYGYITGARDLRSMK